MRIIIFLLLLPFFGCANTVHISSKADSIYSPYCTIAVSCTNYDPLGIQQELENLLRSKGFSVVSERLARIKVRMQRRENTFIESEGGRFPERPKELHSILILRFSYEYYPSAPWGYYTFDNFSASLVDLTNGDVLASADFSQSISGTKSVLSVLEDFANKLTVLIEK